MDLKEKNRIKFEIYLLTLQVILSESLVTIDRLLVYLRSAKLGLSIAPVYQIVEVFEECALFQLRLNLNSKKKKKKNRNFKRIKLANERIRTQFRKYLRPVPDYAHYFSST